MKTKSSVQQRSAVVSAGPAAVNPKGKARHSVRAAPVGCDPRRARNDGPCLRLVLRTQPRSKTFVRFAAILALVVFATLNCCLAQQPVESRSDTNKSPPPANLTTQQDHRLMMELLGIKSLRPGANPNNPNATNAVNLDEAKANPYPTPPDPLVLKNGDRVTSAEMWLNKRRPEIVEDFDREIYGRVPTNVPPVKWEL